MMEEGRVNEEEWARKREKNIKKRRKARETKKEVRREERKRRERMEEFRQKLREWREHQTRIASPAKRPKIWGDFNSIWATEEFKTVHGPNLNSEWIT